MNKKVGIILASVLLVAIVLSAVLIPLATCKKGEGKKLLSASGYTVSRVKEDGGYAICVEKNGYVYTTGSAAVGVRFDKNDFNAAPPVYKPYSEVTVANGVAVGKGSISSDYGTVISFSDYYSVAEDGVHVDRIFTVSEAGEDYGFMTELKLQSKANETVLDSEWFIPANYYVNGTHTFLNSAARMSFQGSSIVINAEDVTALMLSRYKNGHSFTVTDTTPGYRETTVNEKYSSSTSLCIDENINIPGLTVANNDSGSLDFSHVYPAYTNNAKDVYTWRMLPVKKGLTRNVSFVVSIGEEKSFDEVMKSSWRRAYSLFAYADKRYTANDVYEVLIDRVDGSYSANNAWGKIPMYSTDADHYHPDSGFLYRNIEFGTLMLSEGRQRGDAQMIENAWKVIEYQLENDKLEYVNAYAPDNSVYKRVMYDGFEGALNLYVQELEAYEKGLAGCADKQFLNWLLNYIIDKAEKFKDDESLMALTFYVPLWRYGDLLYVNYGDVAQRLLTSAFTACEDYKGFYGAIENSNNLISVVEDYMILLRAFVDAYEIDGRQKWLNKAVEIANYLETYQMIQPFSLNPVGATGAEGKNLAFIGNERFLAHGYVFNNSVHDVLDGANTSSVIEYYRLYEYTGDEHYLSYAEDKLFNAFIYINMGDKVGHMDDPVQSSGKGFMNEFVGNGMGATGIADLGMRGAAHDSVIAWNIWQIVQPLKWFKDNCGSTLPEEISASLVHDLAKTKYVSGEGVDPAHSAQKAVDGNPHTAWVPGENKTAVIDLNEFCSVNELKITAGDGARGFVSFSKDGNIYSAEQAVAFSGASGSAMISDAGAVRYVKIRMDSTVPVSKIEVLGVPVFYKTLSEGAQVVSCSEGAFADCIDASNYRTVWNGGIADSTPQAVIDLGEVKDIFQAAIKPAGICKLAYKIEISDNNTDWTVYAEQAQGEDKFIFVSNGYARARYVRITLIGTSAETYRISDIKIQGA